MVTKRRIIPKKDFKRIEDYVKAELEARKTSTFRKKHENIWTEIDRQVSMETMQRVSQDGRPIKAGWHNVFELGELSKASEIITADVMRIIFPDDRTWFEPHVKLQGNLTESGEMQQQQGDKQAISDGVLRSLMAQQHLDFGFKARFKLSIKECLHHGSFVADCRYEKEMMVESGDRVQTLGAPVWVPYSMWNSYPDPSPAVHGTNLFYNGSMILIEYMPLWKLKRMTGEGWMSEQYDKIPKQQHKNKDTETTDVQMIRYLGDLNLERGDGDIYLPNSKCILANGVLVYWSPNDLPFPSVVFNGYERQDIRDPYYTSPLIKQSPMQKFTTIMANKFADAIELRVNPPIEYDGNDPDYVLNDGPDLSPGSKTPTRSMGKGMKALEVGDPQAALEGLTLGMRQLQEGTGVSSIRTGVNNSDRQTATEVRKVAQGSEVRTVDFVSVLEPGALRPFLYMQHMLNRKNLDSYEFYNSEMHTPDWVRYTREDVDHDAHFDIVGSKGLLGEEQRNERVGQVTSFASGNPLFAPLLKPQEILLEMYRNAGQKSAEQFVQIGQQQIPPEVQMKMQQAQQMIQALQQELQKAQGMLKDKSAELQLKASEAAQEQKLELQKAVWAHQDELKKITSDFVLGMQKIQMEAQLEAEQQRKDGLLERARMIAEIEPKLIEAVGSMMPKMDTMESKMHDQMMGMVQKLTDSVEQIKADVKGQRTKRIKPKLDANGDVIGGEIETAAGDKYETMMQ